MLREISSGGKYMKDVILPNATLPIISIFTDAVAKAKAGGRIKDIHPLYTFFQLFGSVVLFNAFRIILQGTDIHKALFGEGFISEYRKNLLLILNEGIVKT